MSTKLLEPACQQEVAVDSDHDERPAPAKSAPFDPGKARSPGAGSLSSAQIEFYDR